MAEQVNQLAQRFVEGLHAKHSMETFEVLNDLVEHLENKNDPEPVEIRLMAELYEFIEKLNHLQNNLKVYVNETTRSEGDALNNLYENTSYDGNLAFKD